jgi:hypothetical protein
MIQTLDHSILSSLKEYINYRILKDLQAYKDTNVTFTKYKDNRFASKNVYGSSYPFWVYDESISSGVPSGIDNINRGTSGLAIDFKNGRIITNTGVNITGSMTVPVNEFHVYITTKAESQLINETNYLQLPDLKAITGPIPPDKVILPAVFLRFLSSKEEPYSLGGVVWATYNVRLICLTNSINQMVGLQHVIRGLNERMVPLLFRTPLNEYNDLKSYGWNYENILSNTTDKFYIEDSSFQSIQSDMIAEKNPNMQIGVGLLKIAILVQPRYRELLLETDEVILLE